MAISYEKICREDEEFWLAVKETISILIPIIGVQYSRYEMVDPYPSKRPRALKMQIGPDGTIKTQPPQTRVCYRADISPATEICDFFSQSPLCYIPLKKYVCNVSGRVGPLAIDELGMLMLLWNMCANSPDRNYVTALCQAVQPIFRQGNDIYWSARDLWKYDRKKLPVQAFQHSLRTLYPLWVRYIQRHYDRQLLGTDSKSKVNTISICFEGLRNLEKKTNGPSVSTLLNSFQLIDDTLCLMTGEDNPQGVSLSKTTLREALEKYGFSTSVYSSVTELLCWYQKYLIDEKRKWREQGKETAGSRTQSLAYAYNQRRYEIKYDKKIKIFTCSQSILGSSNPKTRWRKELPVYIENKIPVDAPKEFLYQLSGGSLNVLRELAVAVAQCISAQQIYNGAILIPKDAFEYVVVLLEWLTESIIVERNLDELAKDDAVDFFITQKANRQPITLAVDSNQHISGQKWNRLKKLISGATVTSKDSILGRKKHKNEAQWLIIGDTKTAQRLRKHEIPYTYLDIKRLPFEFSDIQASRWLQFIFPLWGMIPMRASKSHAIQIKSDVLGNFLRCNCVFLENDSAFLPARTLYDAYVIYCQRLGEVPLLFKDFNRIMEQNYFQQRVRCHTSKGSNRTGYRRIQLRDAEIPIKSIDAVHDDGKVAFFQRIDEIQDEVLNCFPEFPFRNLLGL